MKRWPILILLVAVVVAAFVYLNWQGLGLARLLGGATAASGTQSERIVWKKVDHSAEGFRLELPGEPHQMTIPAYNESGGADMVQMISANSDPETTFSITWADNPPVARINSNAPDRVLEMARDDALAHTQTSLTHETRTTVDGAPVLDFEARNSGGGLMSCRLVYAAPRLYMLTAAYPTVGARHQQDVEHFFKSFTLNSSGAIPETMPMAPAPSN